MTRLIYAALLIAPALLVSPALADFAGHGAGYFGGDASWTRLAGYYAGNGGEFTLYHGDNLLLGNSHYSAQTRGRLLNHPESFQTFCVERSEYVYTGEKYKIWVSTAWADGSNKPQWDPGHTHHPQSHAWKGGASGDDLNPQTAYLYATFATGGLSTYNYTPGVGRAASAEQLQKAIWVFEEGYTLAPTDVQAAAWVLEANNSGWTDIGNVRVLQVYKVGSPVENRQDMLYLVPAPAAALLGVIGLGLVGWVKRRLS